MSGATTNTDIDSAGGVISREAARWCDAAVPADAVGQYRGADAAGVDLRAARPRRLACMRIHRTSSSC